MKKSTLSLSALFLLLTAPLIQAQDIDACLTEQVLTQDDSITIGELKALCSADQVVTNSEEKLIFNRGGADSATPFELYKENYFTVGSMRNSNGGQPFSGDKVDIMFQLSFKYQMFHPEANGRLNFLAPLHVGYTQKAWWDVGEDSAPFAELNYNPEVFWDFSDHALGNFSFRNRLGIEHQSNGRDGPQSRSWNKVYWKCGLQSANDQFSIDLKLWDPVDVGEENIDITDYLGNAKLYMAAHITKRFWVELATTKGDERSVFNTQIDLIYKPALDFNPRLFLRYYKGYGEALISYNIKTESLRLGFDFPLE